MLAVASGKGGTGKTTTTLGLAAALPGTVYAADADWGMPNLHSLAGTPRAPTLAALRDGTSLDDAGHEQPEHGRGVLPAPKTAAERERPREALAAVRRAAADADVRVLLDCPAGAGPDAALPLSLADGALLVSTPCAVALRDAAKTAAMARALGTPVRGVVLTRARAVPPAVEELLGAPVLAAVPSARPPVLADDRVENAYETVAEALAEPIGGVTGRNSGQSSPRNC